MGTTTPHSARVDADTIGLIFFDLLKNMLGARMATVLSMLSKTLWILLALFIGVYVFNFIFVGEALITWDFYTWLAHVIVITLWSLLAFALGFGAKKLRARAV